MTIHTTRASLLYKKIPKSASSFRPTVDWYCSTKFVTRKLLSPPPLLTNTPQNYTPHIKEWTKKVQIQTTHHTSTDTYKYSYMCTSPTVWNHNHSLEFTVTQSVCDSNGAGLQGRSSPPSPPQPVNHTVWTPLYITTDALSIHCKYISALHWKCQFLFFSQGHMWSQCH